MTMNESSPPDLVEFESSDRRSVPSSLSSHKLDKNDDSHLSATTLPSSTSQNNTFSDDSGNAGQAIDGTSAILAASLQALATHCAHLQFRLHQVLAAPAPHRDQLLSELAEFASKPVDFIGDVTNAAVPPLIEGLDAPPASTSVVPTRMLEHLKTQVVDLERFVSYLQKNEPKSSNNSVSESAEMLNHDRPKASGRNQSRRSSDLELAGKGSDYESDEDPALLPLHIRLWQSLACGRSRQRVRNTDSDGSDNSDAEGSGKKIVQRQPTVKSRLSDGCDEDTESVIILLETTSRAFIAASESEMESRIEALAYSLAVALTHGMKKDKLARSHKSPVNAHGSRPSSLPVAANCWNFLKFLYDSQGGPPSTEVTAARLRATFDVPEPTVDKTQLSSKSSYADIITHFLGAINRIQVEEEDETSTSPRRKSTPLVFAGDANVSIGIHSWGRFVRLGLARPSEGDKGASYPLVHWVRAISSCHRLLRNTHFSWAPIRSAPERLIQAVGLLDELSQQEQRRSSSPGFSRRTRQHDANFKGRRKLSSQNSNILGGKAPWAAEDVIIPSV